MSDNWGARYFVMSEAMDTIVAIAESLSPMLEDYDPDKGGDLIATIARTYVNAVNNYSWPEECFWKKWASFKEWERAIYRPLEGENE